jgi:hypothetical protein
VNRGLAIGPQGGNAKRHCDPVIAKRIYFCSA